MRARGGHRRKWLKRGPGAWLAWVGMHGLKTWLQIIPVTWVPPTGRGLGRMMYRLMRSRRRIAQENLRLALGRHLDPPTRRRILQTLMVSLGTTLGELGHPQYLRKETLQRHVVIQGLRHLDEALAAGNGAILVSAHFGNFPLMLARLGLEGYRVGVIIRDPRHRPTARFLDRWRSRFGISTLRDKPRWASVKESLAFLQEGGVLVMHIDLNVSHGGLFVPFFGQWVPTFRGPALLSLRTGAPALPAFIRRIHGLHHRLTIEPPLAVPRSADREEDAWRLLLALSRTAEAAIRRHPEQWWWIHRRFRKSRPAEEVGRPLPNGPT